MIGEDTVSDEGIATIQDPYDYIIKALDDKKDTLKNSIVKLKIVCTKEQKAKMDICETRVIAYLLGELNVYRIKSVGYEITDKVSVRNAEINESLNPVLALRKWVDMRDYKDDMAQHILLAGENILQNRKDK